jgi:hypothetical protein
MKTAIIIFILVSIVTLGAGIFMIQKISTPPAPTLIEKILPDDKLHE